MVSNLDTSLLSKWTSFEESSRPKKECCSKGPSLIGPPSENAINVTVKQLVSHSLKTETTLFWQRFLEPQLCYERILTKGYKTA